MGTATTLLQQRLEAALDFQNMFKTYFASGTDIFKIVGSNSSTGMINLINLKTGATSTVDPLSVLFPNATPAPTPQGGGQAGGGASSFQNFLSLGSTGAGL